MANQTALLASLDIKSQEDLGQWWRKSRQYGVEDGDLPKAILLSRRTGNSSTSTRALRGVCDSDGPGDALAPVGGPNGKKRIGRARALDCYGTAVASKIGQLLVIGPTADATTGGFEGFTLGLDAGNQGSVLDDTYAAQGALLVQTHSSGAFEFDYEITPPATSAARAATCGVIVGFFLHCGHPAADIFGIQDHEDFAP